MVEVGRILLFEARRRLDVTGNIHAGINYFLRGQQNSIEDKAGIFDAVLQNMLSRECNPEWYKNLANLKLELTRKRWNSPIPTLEEVITRYNGHNVESEKDQIVEQVDTSLTEIRGRITGRKLSFPHELYSPERLAAGLLIEGYGVFLEKLVGVQGLARPFVLGFEEALITDFSDSCLFADVIYWMDEDMNEFS